MNQTGIIELRNLRFHAYHGCLAFEREKGADYVVDLKCEAALAKASGSDCLEDTVDYSLLYDIVAQQMGRSCNLLEHVAGNILRQIKAKVPEIISARVTICKMNPPFDYPPDALSPEQSAACVTLGF